jgi:hypothetical protein
MILTIGTGGSGLTFLNWSIIYLRGDDSYTLLNNNNVIITDNPILTNGTAHGQAKDHINHTADLINLHSSTKQSVIYVVPTRQSDMEYILQFSGKKIIFDSSVRPDELLARMCYVMKDTPLSGLIKDLSTRYNIQSIKQVLVECNKFFTDYYTVPSNYTNYYSVDYNDIFQNLDQKIYDVFKYLELPISQDRMNIWVSVYSQYRNSNQNFLSLFLGDTVEIDKIERMKIFKEIIQWKNGLYQNT